MFGNLGAFVNGKYSLVSRIDVPEPRRPADGRHAITLSRLSNNEFRWDTAVDFAIGSIRPADVASVLSRLVSSAEGKSEREARADLEASAPRTSGALGQVFSLDSLRPTRLGDGPEVKTLTVTVKADTTYYLAAKFNEEKRNSRVSGEYWDPVVWREKPDTCG